MDEDYATLRQIYLSAPFRYCPGYGARYYHAEHLSDAHILAVLLCNQRRLLGYDQCEVWHELELDRLFGISSTGAPINQFQLMRARFAHSPHSYDFAAVRNYEIRESADLIVRGLLLFSEFC